MISTQTAQTRCFASPNPHKTRGLASLLIVVLMALGPLNAQNMRPYIGVTVGASLPMGDLSSDATNNPNAVYANAGGMFDISFNYPLGKGYFGLTALLRAQAMPTDIQNLKDIFAQLQTPLRWTSASDAWISGSLLMGGYASYPLTRIARIEGRAMLGASYATLPEFNISGAFFGQGVDFTRNSASNTSLAYLLGLGYRLSLGNRVDFISHLDYFSSSPTFTNITLISPAGTLPFGSPNTAATSVNLSLGIAFKL